MAPQLECAIFCDDIREEAGNKTTLVGIYGKYLLIPPGTKFPSALRQVCLFLRWTGVEGGEKLLVSIDYENEEIFKPHESEPLKTPLKPEDYGQTSIYFLPFLLKGFGSYKFRVYLENIDNLVTEEILHIGPQP